MKKWSPKTEDGERISIELNDEDSAKIDARWGQLGFVGTVTDQATGKRWQWFCAPCGLPTCNCDAIVKPVSN